MNKKSHSKNQPLPDPFDVFVEMRRRGLRQVYYAKKFHVSEPAITYALQGKSNPILKRIAKHLNLIP